MTDSVQQETYNIQKSETIQNSYGMCHLDLNTEKNFFFEVLHPRCVGSITKESLYTIEAI